LKKSYFLKIFFILLFIIVVDNLFSEYFRIKNIEKDSSHLANIDTVVVLTGAKGRILEGFKFINIPNIKYLIISGANPFSPKEDILSFYTDYKDYFPKIIIERRSTNTIENAVELKKIIYDKNISNLLIITSQTHIYRTKYIFNKIFTNKAPQIYFWSINEDITLKKILKEKIKLIFDIIYLNLTNIDQIKPSPIRKM